jgi:hypothetical protein
MAPGDYSIPDKISRAHAQCAVIDGAGKVVKKSAEKPEQKAEEKPRGRGRPAGNSRTKVAPENKQLGSAPEDKSEVEGAAGDSGGDGAGSDAGSGSDLPGEPPADDSGQ